MALNVELEWSTFSCCLCLDRLKDPVTTTCGHSYCSECIKGHWDVEEEKRIYSCPQCRKTFTPRPVLEKCTMLAALMETLEKTVLQEVPADHRYAGAEDVACDVCTGRKLKALKSCLVCRASYCDSHLLSHHQSVAFQRHKLVDPTKVIEGDICAQHKDMMALLNKAEQLSRCCFCSVEEHKERRHIACFKREYQPEIIRKAIQDRIKDREEDMNELQYERRSIEHSVCEIEKEQRAILSQLQKQLERRLFELQGQLCSRRIAEDSRVLELQKKLDKEIIELRKSLSWVDGTELTDFSTEFLHNVLESTLSQSPDSYSLEIPTMQYFADLRTDLSKFRDALLKVLMGTHTKMSKTMGDMDVSEPQPTSREDFLRYSRLLTLDPNTAHKNLSLFQGNRAVTHKELALLVHDDDHLDRFVSSHQVMSKESLTGRSYWEVERSSYLGVAMSYWNVNRAGKSEQSGFGSDDMSWCLHCLGEGYWFRHNGTKTVVKGPVASRVGVYLDHSAGLLSYYSVGRTMERLVTVQTTFTQPLHAGLIIGYCSSSELFDLNSQPGVSVVVS